MFIFLLLWNYEKRWKNKKQNEGGIIKILLLKGLPASGKSTYAKQLEKEHGFVRISKDDIRKTIKNYNIKKESRVVVVRNKAIRAALAENKNVVIDDTNLNPIHEKNISKIAEEFGADFEINDSFLEVSVEECIKRDLARPNSVGQNVIYGMYYKWIKPVRVLSLERQRKLPRAIIFDLDGTLSINTTGRSFYDMSKVDQDMPNHLLTLFIDILTASLSDYCKVILVSGRDETGRANTEKWLAHNCIDYEALYMRQEGDKRKDTIVKKEIYDKYIKNKYAVLGIFDDRPSVCNMWRELGLQVAQMGNPYMDF